MKTAFHFTTLLPIVCFLLAGSCARPAPAGEEGGAPGLEGLHQALDDFDRAYARADVAALGQMLTEGYLHTNGANPPLDKDKWLQYVASRRKAIDAGSLVIDHYALLGLKTRLYGSSAAVSARARINGLDENGPFEHEYQVTQLWVFEQGAWKRAAFHDGQVK